MFRNPLHFLNDPFMEMETSTKESEHASSTAETHFVEPHYVEGYEREDGRSVEGYWRDGDGDTSEDRTLEDGGGYEQTNPDDDLTNNLD